jgi:hypothetical protein
MANYDKAAFDEQILRRLQKPTPEPVSDDYTEMT